MFTKWSLSERFDPRHGAIALSLATFLFVGCRREGITVYRVPKEKGPEMTEAQGAEGTQPQLEWKTPPGWQEQTPSEMSIASFSIPGDQGRKAQLAVMTFPGEGAAELSLINIVRENAGLPPITEEELARLVGQYAEKARIAVRNVRRDGMDHLKQDEKKHDISEDERKRLEHEVQKLTDETIKEIDELADAKEREILGK